MKLYFKKLQKKSSITFNCVFSTTSFDIKSFSSRLETNTRIKFPNKNILRTTRGFYFVFSFSCEVEFRVKKKRICLKISLVIELGHKLTILQNCLQ